MRKQRRRRDLKRGCLCSLCSRVAAKMGDEEFRRRQLANTKTQFDYKPPGIDVNLIMGCPPNHLLQKASFHFQAALNHRMGSPDAPKLFQYGPEAGELEFRTELAKFLSRHYWDTVNIEDMVVTNGATQGLYMLTSLLFSPGDLVFVEDPTYFVALKILRDDIGLQCVPVPIDDKGVVPDLLEENIKLHVSGKKTEGGSKRPFWSMLYLVSTIHNPTGVSLSPERCRRIVQIARKYNLLVVSDDVYNLLAFSKDKESSLQRKRLYSYDDPNDSDYVGNVVSNGTFSKIFGPGLRIGWQEVPANVKKILLLSGWLRSGGGLNHTVSGVMSTVISMGLMDKHIEESVQIYQSQCEAICKVMKEKVPSATFIHPQGGYFIWIKLPPPLKATELLDYCKRESKILFSTGDVASLTSQFKDCFRLSFSCYSVDELTDATSKIADSINFLLSSK